MLGGIKAALKSLDGNEAMDEVNATEALKLDVKIGRASCRERV